MTPSLSETFEPPSTTTYGRSGSSVSRSSTSTSAGDQAAHRRAAAAARRRTRWPACGARRRSRRRRRRRPSAASCVGERAALGVVLAGLARVEPDVLQQRDVAVGEPGDGRLRADSPTVSVAKATGRPSSSPSRVGDRRQGVLRSSGAPFGPAEVGAARRPGRPRSASALIVGTRGPDPAVVGDRRAVERHVQVGADEHALAAQVAQGGEVSHGRVGPGRSEALADERDEVDEAVGVAPLVVVPADDLDLVADHLGQAGVEDARARVGDDVGGDDRVLGVLQDSP